MNVWKLASLRFCRWVRDWRYSPTSERWKLAELVWRLHRMSTAMLELSSAISSMMNAEVALVRMGVWINSMNSRHIVRVEGNKYVRAT
jgi:hypothetical protein